ncbi:MAG: 3-deoxy-manno-octulosonate cytidylyltransferase, partial [Nitrospinaceae bacterium]|nr:3-deoxy-manno-octulosonate cytidylyltransferase [Nitrospinaceae bacterium]NIR54727.1 3-deoxy-manno-octulosonate cytidylyltransferase [Nitrospinaceae bacterium]NIS85147.1 3-deoxy-manno-octulosonate cytidylyltransferase [Nitrospinaceae bacterium]NIT81964.1 3-deoxy-manno-octulosonate cytidylyltransferase [Nitrospinaceae bacterium]NIU44226.1 3-deoxy-manno-octulosonate cytidylyltransferase [Nitrospinaceae bacterium]
EAVENLECDIVVNVQGDEPLMPPDNIDLVVRALADSSDVPVSTLKMRIDNEDDLNNAHITKVVVDRRGRALYFSRAPIPHDREARLRTSGDLETLETARAPGYKHIGLY